MGKQHPLALGGRESSTPSHKNYHNRGQEVNAFGNMASHFGVQQNFSAFSSQQRPDFSANATSQDMDMYKRLKRLEKFEDQLKQKHKQNKPKLMNP